MVMYNLDMYITIRKIQQHKGRNFDGVPVKLGHQSISHMLGLRSRVTSIDFWVFHVIPSTCRTIAQPGTLNMSRTSCLDNITYTAESEHSIET